MQERLSRHDRDLLLDLIDCCHTEESTPDFFNTVHPRLRALLPHQIFAYGRVHTRDARMLQVVNAGFPKEYLDQVLPAESGHHCPMLGRWVRAQRPIYYDQHAKRRGATVSQPCAAIFADPALATMFADLGLQNIAVHGVMDAAQTTATCYGFAHLEDQWSDRSATLLRIVTPHLYAALNLQVANPTAAPDGPRRKPLTEREQHVLLWMSHGKSSIEIGKILDISISTVHVHTQNIIRKLGADNRVHAVALALRTGVIGL